MQALVHYQQNNVADGDTAVSSAVAWQQHGSARQFQLQLLGQLVGNENLSARNALAIYDQLLREPAGAEWIRDPLDALTAWSTPAGNTLRTVVLAGLGPPTGRRTQPVVGNRRSRSAP